jgi:general secretion pathway protein K
VIERRVAQQLLGLLANPRLDLLFSERDADGQYTDRIALVGALVDYGDSDVNQFDVQSLLSTSASGGSAGSSEDSFYSNLHPPYLRRNAPFDSVEELRMVRGLNSDDLWSAIVDPDPGNPRRRTLTVWGQGLVNVNTANAQTLLALICAFSPASRQCTDVTASSQFISSVTMLQAFTLGMGIPLFTTPHQFVDTIQGRAPMGPMLTALGMQPFTLADAGALERAVTTESKVFSIFAEASVGQAHARIHAVVDMRAQPPVPTMFQQAMSTGIGGRAATADTAVVQTAGGNLATVSSAGGVVVYWREE